MLITSDEWSVEKDPEALLDFYFFYFLARKCMDLCLVLFVFSLRCKDFVKAYFSAGIQKWNLKIWKNQGSVAKSTAEPLHTLVLAMEMFIYALNLCQFTLLRELNDTMEN